MTNDTTTEYLPVPAMRDWIMDCVWGDLDADDVPELGDAAIVRGIERHYPCGVDGFLMDGLYNVSLIDSL